jgi:hypothetical protein
LYSKIKAFNAKGTIEAVIKKSGITCGNPRAGLLMLDNDIAKLIPSSPAFINFSSERSLNDIECVMFYASNILTFNLSRPAVKVTTLALR